MIVTPGQDTALTVRNTMLGGRRAGLVTAVGAASGQAVWTVAASAGIVALLVAAAGVPQQSRQPEDGRGRVRHPPRR